ncbi:MAG: glucose/mannose-6-phosphate isomerase [Streptosporangiaceae bacterium]|nr:glucose/mannose-6-phosphate isomerase [Streptosporangiaceae bacterium]
MTLTAQERLDDPALVEAADPGGVLRQAASAAAQVRTSARVTAETDLGAVISAGRPRSVVVTGMGGSGVAGEVLAAVCGPGSASPVIAQHDYRLPAWVGAADLVIAVSCSGTTEETLSAAEGAVRRGCPLLGVGGAGSPLARIAEQARAPFVPVQPAGMPRFTLWGLAVPLMVVADRLGVADIPADTLETAAADLERVSHLCRPDSESFVNPAKTLALELDGTLPMIWGSSPLTGVAATRFACQLNENAKYPAIPGVLPEANHNQVVVFDGPFAPWAATGPRVPGDEDPRPAVPLRLVLLRDSQEHPQVARRRKVSAELAEQHGIGVSELAADGETALQRLAGLLQLIDYATVYLGIAIGVDPGPVGVISDLKERIA